MAARAVFLTAFRLAVTVPPHVGTPSQHRTSALAGGDWRVSAPGFAAQRIAARQAEAEGDFAGAERALRAALAADARDGESVFALAEFLLRRRRYGEAEPLYDQMRRAFPRHPALLNSLAILYSKTGRTPEAIGLWQQVMGLQPGSTQPLVNIGLALRAAGDTAGAIARFMEALSRDPDLVEAHYNLAVTYYHAKRLGEALPHLEAARRLSPENGRVLSLLAQSYQGACDWDRLDGLMPDLRREIDKAVAGRPCAINPWYSLRLPLSRAERKAVAAQTSHAFQEEAAATAAALDFRFDRGARQRLTIGYISADFRDHPIMQLTAGLYRRHDRERFRIHAYPVTAPSAEAATVLASDCDRVVDLSSLSDTDAARRIHADKVDILVDISGFGTTMRFGILALRPAPLQVSYLNFPGTLSNFLYDYLIGDPTVTPAEHAADYLETLARLPDSYQVNNRDQTITPPPSRIEEGLPEEACVFACFSLADKIERAVFAHWMRLLSETPASVLWLFAGGPAQGNLRAAAGQAGIDPTRLVFADRKPKAEHLARLSLADLHLDTGTYGAHTTASDALWAGVPAITVLGEAFPARVGASLLRAVGLPELICPDWPAYVRLAGEFGRQPDRRRALRAKLAAQRLTAPLFDTDRTARGLEDLYRRMWERVAAGVAPQPLDIQ
jgi:protein O-GlcNAc transferase